MIVDSHNDRIGCLIGRLFAVVEHAQELCHVEAGESVRMRFMDAVPTTPQRAIPEIMKAYNKCYVVMMRNESGEIGELERVMDEIGSLLGHTAEGIPKVLATREQCDFFIGYRHQRIDLQDRHRF